MEITSSFHIRCNDCKKIYSCKYIPFEKMKKSRESGKGTFKVRNDVKLFTCSCENQILIEQESIKGDNKNYLHKIIGAKLMLPKV